MRKEFQRIQENNRSAFEDDKPLLHLKRIAQPPQSNTTPEQSFKDNNGNNAGVVRMRPPQSFGAANSGLNSKQQQQPKLASHPHRSSRKILIDFSEREFFLFLGIFRLSTSTILSI